MDTEKSDHKNEKSPLLSSSQDFEKGRDAAPDEGGADGTFKYKVGMILSCVGCMVGTGNIWRFPRIAANNSGEDGALQFLIAWIIFLFMWSIPMLIIEYAVGRYIKKSPVEVYKQLLGPRNMWCGGWILIVDLGITCYYSVVLGWCFYYSIYTMANPLPTDEANSTAIFDSFTKESYWPLLTHGMATMLSGLAVLWGVKSIELVNSVIVPIFLVLILTTFIWSLTLEYASIGIKYLFTPDWNVMSNPQMWIDAASQNAWDTGAGMGLFVAYAGYMTASNGIVRFSFLIPACNNIVSLICGMTTFATVFAVQKQKGDTETNIVDLLKNSGEANTGLTFIWVPILYSTMDFGRVLAAVFFLALSFAGLSSMVANVELITKTLLDFGVNRKLSVLFVSLIVFGFGCISATNMSFLVNQDFVWGFALIISGTIFQYLVIRYGSTVFRATLLNEYSISDWYLPKLWEWIVKYVAPVEAFILLLWFTVNEIFEHPNDWYDVISEESLMTCVVQWLGVIFILNIINVIYVFCYLPRKMEYENLDLGDKQHNGELLNGKEDIATKPDMYVDVSDFEETKH